MLMTGPVLCALCRATFRSKLVPNAVRWYTGEANEEDEDEDDEDYDDDEVGDDDDEDDEDDDDDDEVSSRHCCIPLYTAHPPASISLCKALNALSTGFRHALCR